VQGIVDLSWHSSASVVIEPVQGLTHARWKGFTIAKGDVIVLVDDDNILAPGYLDEVRNVFQQYDNLGAIGGRSIPVFEAAPPAWIVSFYANLALRDLGDEVILSRWSAEYPDSAPIGAGMGLRKKAIQPYVNRLAHETNVISDRSGKSLGSGGDNDLVLEILKSGWQVGYFPSLSLQHIIPGGRLTVSYLARLINQTNKSWIAVLEKHKINPWLPVPPWTLPLRKIKAWFTYRAWSGQTNYIKWRGACGQFDGLAESFDKTK
jgi:GT2 family glycosyltransferase